MMATLLPRGAAGGLRSRDHRRRQHAPRILAASASRMVRNAIFTVGLVQFFFIWNDLLIVADVHQRRSDLRTIQVGLLNFTGQYGAVQYGPLFAAMR